MFVSIETTKQVSEVVEVSTIYLACFKSTARWDAGVRMYLIHSVVFKTASSFHKILIKFIFYFYFLADPKNFFNGSVYSQIKA